MTVTFLEMKSRPSVLPPPQPRGKVALLRSEKPPTHCYRYLYDTIGADYYWVDRKKLSPEALAEVIHDPRNLLFILYTDGNPAGLAELADAGGPAAGLAGGLAGLLGLQL